MRNLQTVVLPILILGGLILFTVENWSPSVALVIFGANTIALPLSLWVISACLLGSLTTVAIALCLTLLIRTSSSPTKERVQSFSSVPPRSPRPEDTRPLSPKESRPYPSNVDSRPTQPKQGNRPSSQAVSSETPEVTSGETGMGDWEEFTRPREEWDDWQRSTPIVTEVAGEHPINGSRFETVPREKVAQPQDSHNAGQGESSRGESSSANEYGDYDDRPSDRDREQRDRHESYAPDQYGRDGYAQRDAYAQNDYDRREYAEPEYEQGYGRDRNSYDRDDYDRDDYGGRYSEASRPNAYPSGDSGQEPYSQEPYPQEQYDYSRAERGAYPGAEYAGDRYEPQQGDRYDQRQDDYGRPYADDDYGADQYGPENSYGRAYDRGYDRDYDRGNDSPSPSSSESSEQYIMDYGDEAALDAFDAELDARTTHKTRTAPDDENPSSGRYRWKNPFNTQNRRGNDERDDDLDLSSLDDWEE